MNYGIVFLSHVLW